MFRTLEIEVAVSRLEGLAGIRLNTRHGLRVRSVDRETCDSMHERLRRALEDRFGRKFLT